MNLLWLLVDIAFVVFYFHLAALLIHNKSYQNPSCCKMEKDNDDIMIKLTSKNWQIWKAKMEYILYYKYFFDLVEDKKPKKMFDDDWKKQHRKTAGIIHKCLDISVFHHVAEETNANNL